MARKKEDTTKSEDTVTIDSEDMEAIQHILQAVSGKTIDLVAEARKVGRSRDGDLVWVPSEDWRPLVEAAQGIETKAQKKEKAQDSSGESSKDDEGGEPKETPEAQPEVQEEAPKEAAKPKAPAIKNYRIDRKDGPKKAPAGAPKTHAELVAQRDAWEAAGETIKAG